MRYLNSSTRAFFMTKFGRCDTCMRQSLTAALAMWGVFGTAFLIGSGGLVQNLVGLVAIGLTFLWLLHVAAYAARALVQSRVRGGQPQGPVTTRISLMQMEPDREHIDRRRALKILVRAAGVGAVASVPALMWPSDAFAFCGQCTKNRDCGSKNSGWKCKNTAPVNSGKVCNECVYS